MCLPLLAECMKVGADLMNALYISGSVALDALVLMPQHMQQRLQLSIDGHEVPVTAIDFRSMKNNIFMRLNADCSRLGMPGLGIVVLEVEPSNTVEDAIALLSV